MRWPRLISTAVLLSLGVVLAGCADAPEKVMDKLTDFSFLDTKKKLPGTREPVFPNGVPGVTQGIPPELVKGYQESSTQAAAASTTDVAGQADAKQPAGEPAAKTAKNEPEPKKTEPKKKQTAKAKPKPKVKRVAARKPQPQPQPTQPAAQPAPATQAAAQAPWPTSAEAQPTAAWPAPVPAGQFPQ